MLLLEVRCHSTLIHPGGITKFDWSNRKFPTGDAPTTSEWSTILLPTRVRLILETDGIRMTYCRRKFVIPSWWYIPTPTLKPFGWVRKFQIFATHGGSSALPQVSIKIVLVYHGDPNTYFYTWTPGASQLWRMLGGPWWWWYRNEQTWDEHHGIYMYTESIL